MEEKKRSRKCKGGYSFKKVWFQLEDKCESQETPLLWQPIWEDQSEITQGP